MSTSVTFRPPPPGLSLKPTVKQIKPQAASEGERIKLPSIKPHVPTTTSGLVLKMPKSQPMRCCDFRTLGLKDLKIKVEQLYQQQTKKELPFESIITEFAWSGSERHTLSKTIGAKFKNLHTLELPDVDVKTLAVITLLFSSCSKRLTHLNVTKSSATDVNLALIGEHCKGLTHLTLRGCEDITDVGLCTAVTMLKHLSYLDIKGATHISKRSLSFIGDIQKRSLPPRLSCIQI